jgi:hypothetical protein
VALVEMSPFVQPWPVGANSFAGMALTATTHRAAAIFLAPETGLINRVGWRLNTAAVNTPLEIRLEKMPSGSNTPSGAPGDLLASAAMTATPAMAGTWIENALGPVAATRGDLLALVIRPTAAGDCSVSRLVTHPQMVLPYTALFGTSWSLSSASPVMALRYGPDDKWAFSPGIFPFSDIAAMTVRPSVGVDEIGNIVRYPYGVRIAGVCVDSHTALFTGGISFNLYGPDDSVLRTLSIGGNELGAAGNAMFLFPEPITIEPDVEYKMTVRNSVNTNRAFRWFAVERADLWAAVQSGDPDNDRFSMVQRVGLGAWTHLPLRRAGISPILSGVDSGGGPGGGPSGRLKVVKSDFTLADVL